MDVYDVLRAVKDIQPLVQCITNIVTVNDCANILLACGASPTMTMDAREVEEAVAGADALVCNMGAIEYLESMLLAGKAANRLGIPVVLDPVGAGRTTLRRDAAERLLQEVQFAVIRGNASEIRALAGLGGKGCGVDVSQEDVITENTLECNMEITREFAQKTGAVITMSGPLDIVSSGEKTAVIRNGCVTMARITGSGCMLTTLIGGFCGAVKEDSFTAACAAVAAMGVSGEFAEERRLKMGTGNATFRNDLIDGLYNLTEDILKERIRYEIYEG